VFDLLHFHDLILLEDLVTGSGLIRGDAQYFDRIEAMIVARLDEVDTAKAARAQGALDCEVVDGVLALCLSNIVCSGVLGRSVASGRGHAIADALDRRQESGLGANQCVGGGDVRVLVISLSRLRMGQVVIVIGGLVVAGDREIELVVN